MRLSGRFVLLVCFIFVTVLLLAPTAAFAATCTDADHDGYGRNCTPGPDCNDNDATIYIGAPELCDGKDNDCNPTTPDGVFEANQTCNTGQPGICGVGTTQCVAGALQCNVTTSPTTETCNDLDDNCDGIVDNLSGDPDADGDGVSASCDCDDGDAALHTALRQDGGGRSYCLQIDPIVAVEGQPASVTVRAYHVDGVPSIALLEEDNVSQTQTLTCGSPAPQRCVVSASVGDYDAPRYLTATIGTSGPSRAGKVSFLCQREYCQPDTQLNDFFIWMRGKRYADCVAGRYLASSLDLAQRTSVFERNIQKTFLEDRGKPNIVQPLVVNFYDIVPTDANTTFITLGAGQGGNCQKSSLWAAFCPSAVPADYTFVERHLERSYGLNLTVVYQPPVQVNYSSTFGLTPVITDGNITGYSFSNGITFPQQFPPHSILHYALQTYNGLPVFGFGNASGGVANTTMEPSTAGSNGAGSYSHEWGHTWGFPHTFLGGSTFGLLPQSAFVSLDGVMDNSYRIDTALTDPTDPLERYGIEPTQGTGFIDDATFANAYSTGITGTPPLPTCGSVDPAITAGVLTSAGADYVFDLTLKNNGTIPVGYVNLRAYDGSPTGRLIRERVIGALGAGETKAHRMTIPSTEPNGQINVTAGKVYFVLDVSNMIAESNESNNTVTVNLPACTDADHDGYPYECIQCFNAFCPVVDCGDSLASVNPGATEGPVGSPTCSDGVDNDCDTKLDLADPGCQPPPLTVTAVSETLTQGSQSGDFNRTKTVNDVYESLTEGGTGTHLIHTWRFDNVQAGASQDLLIKGNRLNNAENENFQFYYLKGNKYVAITGAVISMAREQNTPVAYRIPTLVSGTVFIRVQDTVASGSVADTVNVDYLAIRTNP